MRFSFCTIFTKGSFRGCCTLVSYNILGEFKQRLVKRSYEIFFLDNYPVWAAPSKENKVVLLGLTGNLNPIFEVVVTIDITKGRN